MSEPAPPSIGPHVTLPLSQYRLEVSMQDSVEQARHRRWRDTALFGTALAMFVIVFFVSLWVAFLSDHADASAHTAATGIVVTLVGALAGFLGGRAAK